MTKPVKILNIQNCWIGAELARPAAVTLNQNWPLLLVILSPLVAILISEEVPKDLGIRA
jgi:hypothetical protein